jgi:hypothetical protein
MIFVTQFLGFFWRLIGFNNQEKSVKQYKYDVIDAFHRWNKGIGITSGRDHWTPAVWIEAVRIRGSKKRSGVKKVYFMYSQLSIFFIYLLKEGGSQELQKIFFKDVFPIIFFHNRSQIVRSRHWAGSSSSSGGHGLHHGGCRAASRPWPDAEIVTVLWVGGHSPSANISRREAGAAGLGWESETSRFLVE